MIKRNDVDYDGNPIPDVSDETLRKKLAWTVPGPIARLPDGTEITVMLNDDGDIEQYPIVDGRVDRQRPLGGPGTPLETVMRRRGLTPPARHRMRVTVRSSKRRLRETSSRAPVKPTSAFSKPLQASVVQMVAGSSRSRQRD